MKRESFFLLTWKWNGVGESCWRWWGFHWKWL